MEKQTGVKIFWAVGIVIIFIGFIYFFNSKHLQVAPTQVLTPKGYPIGSTISLYKDIPPGFPAEVVLENQPLKSSGVVTNAAGKQQMSVSYLSTQKVSALVDLYKNSLTQDGWKVSASSINPNAGTVLALKDGDSLVIAITPNRAGAKTNGTLVTFQYEK